MGPIHLTNPAMLYLAAGAVLPIIIHLLSRRRTRNVRFPAVRFLRSSARRSVARVNLKHLLLMLLRMALICLLALILARPVIGGAGSEPTPERPAGGVSAIVMLDDSLSMNYRRGDLTWFERARNHALEVLGQLPAGSEVAVMTTSQPGVQFTRERAELRGRVTSLRAGLAGGSCWPALDRAAAALQGRASGAMIIYLLTDMTRSAWTGLEGGVGGGPIVDLGETVALEIINVGDSDASNIGVTRLSHEGEPLLQGAMLNVEAELLRTGPEAEEVVQFEFDGRPVGQHTVRLPADGSEAVSFLLPIEGPGHHWGRVSPLNEDALAYDNARSFSIEVPGAIRVLCVDETAEAGSPADVESRSYFFRRALSPWEGRDRGVFRLTTVTPEGLEERQLGEFDVVALVDLPGPSDSVWDRLSDFVAGGGGLLVSAGPAMEPGRYAAASLRRLLPAVPGDAVGAAEGEPLRMRVVSSAHPLMTTLSRAGVDVGRAALRRCWRLELTESGEELLSLGPDLPALAVGRAGGRVAVFAGQLGVDWGDFPKREEFLPFCQELVLYLAGADGAQLSGFVVGQQVPVRFEPSSLPTIVVVTPPGSAEGIELMPGTTPGRRLFWKTQAPGYYMVNFRRGGRQWEGGFCVNTPPQESDLRPAREGEVIAAIKAARVAVHKDPSTIRAPRIGSGASGWAGLELTPYIVLLALVAGVLEVFFANRIYRAAGESAEPPLSSSAGRVARRGRSV